MDSQEELQIYLQAARASGLTDDDIRKELISAGWDAADIGLVLGDAAAEKPVIPEFDMPSRMLPRDIMPNQNIPFQEQEIPQDKPRRFFKAPFIFIFIALGILILGGVAYAGYSFWDSRPERVLQQMKENIKKVQNFSYAVPFQIKVNSDEVQADIEGNVEGVVSHPSETGPVAQEQKLHLTFKQDGIAANFGMESRTINDHFYFNLTELPIPQDVMSSFSDMDVALKNQWYEISKEDTDRLLEDSGIVDFIDSNAISYYESPDEVTQQVLSMAAKIGEVWRNLELYHFKERLKDEVLDNVKVYHYTMEIDSGAVQKGIIDSLRIIVEDEGEKIIKEEGEESRKEIEEDTEDLMKEASEELEKIFDKNIQFQPVDLYIGKKDRLPHRMKGGVLVKSDDFGDIAFTISVDLGDYGKAVDVQAPPDAKNLADFIPEMIGGLQTNAFETKIRSDLARLRTLSEMNYNNEYIFLSTDDEINSVRDTIQLEEGELMICVKNGENTNCDTSGSVDLRGEQYAIYIRTSKTGFWHCADSGGNIISELETSGLIPCPPASTTIIHNP